MKRRSILAGLAAVPLASLAACGKSGGGAKAAIDTINFSVLSAQDQQSMGAFWQPVLDDLAKATGLKVKPFFATNYAALIEAMRFNQVQAGWFSALSGLEAVRRAEAKVVARTADRDGLTSYRSVLIVKKGRGLTLDKVLKCDKRLGFGIGDAKSTSGTLAPMSYLFTPRGIEPSECFKTVRSASHQSNFFAVANGVLDVATNNTVGQLFYKRDYPALADKIEIIWTSPDLPESAIVVRKDLDPAIIKKVADFFTTYGRSQDAEGERQRKNLEKLEYSGFLPADDSYLQPIRQMEAGEALREAQRSGDAARIAQTKQAYEAVLTAGKTLAP